MPRHLLRLENLTVQELESILTLARVIKDKTKRGVPHRSLEGKVLAMIFEKASTRTRVSFEVGMYQLGGTSLYLDAQSTQLGRGESIPDTARVLSRYVDGVMIRAYSQQAVEEFALHSSVSVINGLTDTFHPCQILGDLLTIQEKLGDPRNVRVAYVGDGNNVANSWIEAAMLLGFPLVLACPEGYDPSAELMGRLSPNIKVVRDPTEAVRGAHILYTDVWVSMGQEREEKERKRVFAPYQVNEELLERAGPQALVMHCLPAHRGLEITDGVMDGPRSLVFDQAENRLHVQKAILEILLGGHRPRGISME
ncbi:MAG: ornithine carbamoyltransferase [Thermodesulfobacteriota bacterium]